MRLCLAACAAPARIVQLSDEVVLVLALAIAGFLRFMCSFLSGVLVWGNLNEGLSAWTYSLVYNASYMLPETLITVVGAVLLIKAAPQIFDRQYSKA